MTTQQARDKTKDVTRRLGWANLKPGERVQQIEKGQGLKKGEHPVKIHVIECVSNAPEPLSQISLRNVRTGFEQTECEREGFPELFPEQFVDMFCKHNGCTRDTIINRIEFEYVTPSKEIPGSV